MQKRYNKINLNVLGFIFFVYTVYFGIATSHKIFFSRISTSSFSCVQRSFSKMKLVKTLLYVYLKQTNLEY